METENTIIVAVDGSPASQAAVRWAAHTAQKRGKPLHIAAFWESPPRALGIYEALVTDTVRDEAGDNVSAARKLATEVAPGITLTGAAREGRVTRELLTMSERAALIVMGARGPGRFTGAVLGSVSAAVVSHAVCPVVVVRADMPLDAVGASGPVVVGIDGSDISRRAADVAFQEADARGVAVHAVTSWRDRNVYASPAAYAVAAAGQAGRELVETLKREHQDMLDKYLDGFIKRYPNVGLQQTVSDDEPAEALARAAESAQLLVVGSHGRGGFLATILGSTSRTLLRKSPCPLMVVRPPR